MCMIVDTWLFWAVVLHSICVVNLPLVLKLNVMCTFSLGTVVFRVYDVDRDGYISKDDLCQVSLFDGTCGTQHPDLLVQLLLSYFLCLSYTLSWIGSGHFLCSILHNPCIQCMYTVVLLFIYFCSCNPWHVQSEGSIGIRWTMYIRTYVRIYVCTYSTYIRTSRLVQF